MAQGGMSEGDMVIISLGAGVQDRICEAKGGRVLHNILVDVRPPDIILFFCLVVGYAKTRRCTGWPLMCIPPLE